MTVSRQPQITEELLSAYLDDQVTAEERALVEAAIAAEPDIAWQVDSLRQTIHLLQALPPLALPRAFSVEAILAEVHAAPPVPTSQPEVLTAKPVTSKRAPVTTARSDEPQSTWWEWLWQLWQGGNLQLRNAAAVALTLLVVLFAGDRFVVSNQRALVQRQPTGSIATIEVATAPVATPVATATTAAPTPTFTPPVSTADTSTGPSATMGADESAATESVADQTQARTVQAPAPPAAGGRGPDEEDLSGGGSFGGGAPSNSAPMTGDFSAKGSGEPASVAALAVPAPGVETTTRITQQNKVSSVVTSTTEMTTAGVLTDVVTNTMTTTVTTIVTETQIITSTVITPTDNAITTTAVTNMVSSTALVEPPSPNGDIGGDGIPQYDAWLNWAQLIAGLCTVLLGTLWWRSRR